jgi:hypothetical protein
MQLGSEPASLPLLVRRWSACQGCHPLLPTSASWLKVLLGSVGADPALEATDSWPAEELGEDEAWLSCTHALASRPFETAVMLARAAQPA